MTNNEVIIDDKCICYDEGECYNDNCPNRYCKDNNCEHKQLIAKTAECENLKSVLEEIEKFCYRGVGNCDGNEAECNISLILDLINKAKEQE